MLIKIPISQSQLIFSNGEYGFEDVLNDINNTNEIIILTYNISEKKNNLLSLIRNLRPDIKVTMVSNIPKRFKQYYDIPNYDPKINARKNINIYLSKMNRKNFNSDFAPYFNFDNHIKVIMTDNIAYIGSQNFSEDSLNNLEMGFLIDDNDTINKIKNLIFSKVISNSIAYTGAEIDKYICYISSLLDDLWEEKDVIEQIVSNINYYEENSNENDESEDINCAGIFQEDLENIKNTVMGLQTIKEELIQKQVYQSIDYEFTELDNIPGIIACSDLEKYANFNEFEKRKEIYKSVSQLCEREQLKKYINNPSSSNWRLLSDKDWDMIKFINSEVLDKKIQLYKSCFEDFKALYNMINVTYLETETILDNLKGIKDKEKDIDNTND